MYFEPCFIATSFAIPIAYNRPMAFCLTSHLDEVLTKELMELILRFFKMDFMKLMKKNKMKLMKELM